MSWLIAILRGQPPAVGAEFPAGLRQHTYRVEELGAYRGSPAVFCSIVK